MISVDSKIQDILENPAARGVIEKFLPGVSKNPLIDVVKGMSLREVAALKPAKKMGLTPEILASIEKGFKQIKK